MADFKQSRKKAYYATCLTELSQNVFSVSLTFSLFNLSLNWDSPPFYFMSSQLFFGSKNQDIPKKTVLKEWCFTV